MTNDSDFFYISKIISKPSDSVLKEIFSPDAPSGYVMSNQLASPIAFDGLEKLDNSNIFLSTEELGYNSYFSNDILLPTDFVL